MDGSTAITAEGAGRVTSTFSQTENGPQPSTHVGYGPFFVGDEQRTKKGNKTRTNKNACPKKFCANVEVYRLHPVMSFILR